MWAVTKNVNENSFLFIVDAERLWKHMEKNKIDNIFECMHKALLSLQQKIKDGTATREG